MIRIAFEDEELESFVMSGGSMIAVPIQIDEEDGDVTVTVYSRYEETAREFISRFGDDPFCADAEAFIARAFSDEMEDFGYTYEEGVCHVVLNFEAERGKIAPCEISDAALVLIDTEEKLRSYYFDTVRDFSINDGDPVDVAFAAVRDGCVLSVASVNDYSDDGSLEINVETSVGERRKGYGTACVAALCRYLLDLGERVSYKCRMTNTASVQVAKKCGLTYKGKTYSFVCYKD